MEAAQRASPPRHRPTRPEPFRFTRELYHQLAKQGAFEGLQVELLEGEIVVMAPMDAEHGYPVQELTHLLVRAIPDGLRVRSQLPLATDDTNEPEPDLAIVRAGEGHDEHPDSALLAVEVANTSLQDDLTRKARIYARAGIPEYWVLDVKKRELVVHKNPSGEKYKSVRKVTDLSAVKSSAIDGLVLDLRKIFVKR